jgi:glucokinase
VGHACFGIAGPVKNGRSLLTNLRWTIDARDVAKALGGAEVWLMNDLQATAHGIAALLPEDFLTLNQGEPVADGNQAVIAAGTGLGEAGLVWGGARQVAVGSEGGNTDFSPRTEIDIELLRYLQERYEQVIWEFVISGFGLLNIYNFLRDTKRGEEPAWLAEEIRRDEKAAPAVITRNALEKKSPLCEAALDLFVTYYGAESMNLALKFLATGGVFIGGGIAPKITAKLQDGTFMRAFLGSHRYRDLLQTMPVKVILNDKAALLGAARFAALEAGMIF